MTAREKLAAKVANERLKLFADLLNSLAGSALIGSLVAPFVTGFIADPFWSVLVAGMGCVLHLLGWIVLDFIKPEQGVMSTVWLVPLVLGAFGSLILSAAWLTSRRFDRRYPHLSRKGMLEAERRTEPTREAMRPLRIPVPEFRPEEWVSRSARNELDDGQLDRSLNLWGKQVARHPKPAEDGRSSVRR